MAWRTPSSLKWLITKRSRISGALLKLDDERAKLRDRLGVLDGRAESLVKQLAALDQTFGLHEVSMDPEIIRSVRPQTRQRLLPYGQMSRTILNELRTVRGCVSTTEMVVRILNHFPDVDSSDYRGTRHCIKRRLGTLARKGVLERYNSGVSDAGVYDGKCETYWRLAALPGVAAIGNAAAQGNSQGQALRSDAAAANSLTTIARLERSSAPSATARSVRAGHDDDGSHATRTRRHSPGDTSAGSRATCRIRFDETD